MRKIIFFVAVFAVLVSSVTMAQTSAPAIGKISVRLNFAAPVPEVLRQRISESVAKVGEKALIGKSLREAEELKPSLEQVMRKIFNEVISGFEVLNLEVGIGENTAVELDLKGREPRVSSVAFVVSDSLGVSLEWNKVFGKKLKPLEKQFLDALGSTPVESARWSEPLVVELAEKIISQQAYFKGFEVAAEVILREETIVKVALKPVSETIKYVFVKTRSTTMPSLLLERVKFDLAGHAEFMLGLPVEFARENEDEIINSFKTYLEDNSQASRLKLRFNFKSDIQERTLITVQTESSRFNCFLRGKLGLGKEERNPDIEGHLGLIVPGNFELFAEANLLPGPIEGEFDLGLGYHFADVFYAAFGRNFLDSINRIWVDYYITEDIVLSWEKNVTEIEDEDTEGSLTFKAHDFFSISVVSNFQEDTWIRFDVNL
ncbi:MAG TPA: hypothetical protein PLN69_02995 [bacterium]|nr:hypothetical protein [bacterium]